MSKTDELFTISSIHPRPCERSWLSYQTRRALTRLSKSKGKKRDLYKFALLRANIPYITLRDDYLYSLNWTQRHLRVYNPHKKRETGVSDGDKERTAKQVRHTTISFCTPEARTSHKDPIYRMRKLVEPERGAFVKREIEIDHPVGEHLAGC